MYTVLTAFRRVAYAITVRAALINFFTWLHLREKFFFPFLFIIIIIYYPCRRSIVVGALTSSRASRIREATAIILPYLFIYFLRIKT